MEAWLFILLVFVIISMLWSMLGALIDPDVMLPYAAAVVSCVAVHTSEPEELLRGGNAALQTQVVGPAVACHRKIRWLLKASCIRYPEATLCHGVGSGTDSSMQPCFGWCYLWTSLSCCFT